MSLSLTVLGCATPYPRPGAPCSGYLIRTDRATVWVDCGSGTFAALQEHVPPEQVDLLWISHLHPDHSADLLAVFNWAANKPGHRSITVVGPPGWASRLAAVLPMDDARRLVDDLFVVDEHRDAGFVTVHDLDLCARNVAHTVPTYGLRVDHPDGVIAYSGDTEPCAALLDLAQDADLFLCEAGAATPQFGHCTPEQAGSIAANAGVQRLLVTHLPPDAGAETAATVASRRAGCPTNIAVPGLTLASADEWSPLPRRPCIATEARGKS
jgi:ribonuclease BN (tRNA processing enzyme)